MERVIFAFLTVLAASQCVGQTIERPKGMEYDASHDRYLISNVATNQIVEMDQSGALSFFTSTPDSPYGIEILDTVLYVCIQGGVRGYGLNVPVEVFSITLASSSNLIRGITTDGTFLYVADFSDDRIYKVDVVNQSSSTLVSNIGLSPTAMVYDPSNNSLVTVFFGSTTNTLIKTYDADTGAELSSFAPGIPNMEGVALDCFGRMYVASRNLTDIMRFEPMGTVGVPMSWSVNSPGDMDFDDVNKRICVPEFFVDEVDLFDVGDCPVGVEEQESTMGGVYPNPAVDRLWVREVKDKPIGFRILDYQGRVCIEGTVAPNGSIPVRSLTEGSFILLLEDGSRYRFIR